MAGRYLAILERAVGFVGGVGVSGFAAKQALGRWGRTCIITHWASLFSHDDENERRLLLMIMIDVP